MFKKIIKVFLLLVVVMVSGNINTSYGMNYIDYVIESSDEITGDGRHDDLVEPTANAVRDYIAEVGLENFNFNDVIIKVTQYILSSDTRRTREIMNHGGINNYTYIWLGSEIKNNSSFTTYSNGIVSGLSIGCNNGIFTAFNIYVCENGASNYPDCDNNVCENGASNYPDCDNNVCENGASNYPDCDDNVCENGASNYPDCDNNVCENGASNYPDCDDNVCENGASNYPDCDDNVCENGASNYPDCDTSKPCEPGDLDCPVDYSVTTFPTCGTRISSYSDNWGNCTLQGGWESTLSTMNNNVFIKCLQENAWTYETQTNCGTKKVVKFYDKYDNFLSEDIGICEKCSTCSRCAEDAKEPENNTKTPTINIIVDTSDGINESTCNPLGGISADGVSECLIKYNFDVDGLEGDAIILGLQGKKITNVVDMSLNPANQISGNGTGALLFGTGVIEVISADQKSFSLTIPVSSVTPFTSSGNKIGFDIEGTDGTTHVVVENIVYNFSKPFTGTLGVSKDNGNTWSGSISVGTLQQYRIGLQETGSSLEVNSLDGYNLSLEDEDIILPVELSHNRILQEKSIHVDTQTDKGGTIFEVRVNTSTGATSATGSVALAVSNSIITYDLFGKEVKYNVSMLSGADDITPVKIESGKSVGLRVLGNAQLAGKPTITGQNTNNSDLQLLRETIIQAAEKYIASMDSGEIIGGVKYVEGNYTLTSADSGNNYETLVIKNGNLLVGSNNVNLGGKPFGIIVLSSNYNALTANNRGNIYIKPNVSFMNNVSIYADGGFISVDSSGSPYSGDSTQRTADLNKQLVLTGHLFVRSTVGGSILAGGYYILPGGDRVDDFDSAMKYDLNYVRRGNIGWDGSDNSMDGNEYNRGDDSPFVVIMTSNEASNIPKLFKD